MDFDKLGQAAGFGKGMCSNALAELQTMAQERAQRTGETIEKSMDFIVTKDARGRQLYAETCQ